MSDSDSDAFVPAAPPKPKLTPFLADMPEELRPRLRNMTEYGSWRYFTRTRVIKIIGETDWPMFAAAWLKTGPLDSCDYPFTGNIREEAAATLVELQQRQRPDVQQIRETVRYVLDQKFDDICWLDIYQKLAQACGINWKPELLPRTQFLHNCGKFHESLEKGVPYTTPATFPTVREALNSSFDPDLTRRAVEELNNCRVGPRIKLPITLELLASFDAATSTEKVTVEIRACLKELSPLVGFEVGKRVKVYYPDSWAHGSIGTITELFVDRSVEFGHAIKVDGVPGFTVIPLHRMEIVS